MSNSVESNLDALLIQIKEESGRRAPTSRRQEHASDDILVAQILAAIADIERQASAEGMQPDAAMSLVAARTLALTQAGGAAIGFVTGNQVVCRAAAGTAPDVGARVAVDKGLSGECIRSGKTVRLDDAALDARIDPAACAALNLRSAVVVPIHAGSKIVGVLEIFSPEPEAFDDWTVLALSHIAQFVGGMAEPVPPPAEETLPPVSSGPEPIVPSDPAGRRLAHGLRQMAARHGRLALLLFAALVTVAAASYRVRDMVRSARAHRRQEVALTAAPSTIPVPTPVPTSSVPADPQIAREDGRVPEATKALSSDHAKKPQDQPPGEPALATTKAASPQPVTVASANAALRAPEVPPSAPNMTVVEPAAERDISIEPLMNAPVASPQLAAAPARPANASIFVLMSRKLRSLVPKKNHEKSEPPASDQAPPAAGP